MNRAIAAAWIGRGISDMVQFNAAADDGTATMLVVAGRHRYRATRNTNIGWLIILCG